MRAPEPELLKRFCIDGELLDTTELKRGNIHRTFISSWNDGKRTTRFVHQAINNAVFSEPELLMRNTKTVLEHCARCAREEKHPLQLLEIVPSRSGALLERDSSGQWWRTLHFVEDTYSLDKCESESVALEAGRAFGIFQRWLAAIPITSITPPIPRFQHVPSRIDALRAAVDTDSLGRAQVSAREIELALQRVDLAQLLQRELDSGRAPIRIVHADLKINNVLFDQTTHKARCVVDLDTCMPGSVVYDFGDFARSSALLCDEDEKDLSKIEFSLVLFRALARGYLGELSSVLTAPELALLPLAPALIALSLGVRFLTDFLNGDKYFLVRYPEHNLIRARAQLRAMERAEALAPEFREIIENLSPPAAEA